MQRKERPYEDLAAIRQAALDAEPYANPGPEERAEIRYANYVDNIEVEQRETKRAKRAFLSRIVTPEED